MLFTRGPSTTGSFTNHCAQFGEARSFSLWTGSAKASVNDELPASCCSSFLKQPPRSLGLAGAALMVPAFTFPPRLRLYL